MSIPNFVRTEWKSKGAAVVKISDSNCNDCQKEWYKNSDKEDKQKTLLTIPSCPHTRYITCYMSTLNVWEYEDRNKLLKKISSKSGVVKSMLFQIQKPAAMPKWLCLSWDKYWTYFNNFFNNLSWVYRFPNLVDENSRIWLNGILKKYPYLINHIQYYENIPLISELQLSKVDSSNLKEYELVVSEIRFELGLKRNNVHLRLYLHIIECPLNEGMKKFFAYEGITEDPCPFKEYSELLEDVSDKSDMKCKKKIKIVEKVIVFTPLKYKVSTDTELHISKDSNSQNPESTDRKNEGNAPLLIKDKKTSGHETNQDIKEMTGLETSNPETNLDTDPETVFEGKETLDPETDIDMLETSDLEIDLNMKDLSNAKSPYDLEEILDPKKDLATKEITNLDKKETSDTETTLENNEVLEDHSELDLKESLNPERNLDGEHNVKNRLDIINNKENVNPNTETASDNVSEIEHTLNTKKHGGKNKKSKNYTGMAWALKHIQQQQENILQADGSTDLDVGKDSQSVKNDCQSKLSLDTSSCLSTQEETNIEREFDENYEKIDSEVEMYSDNEEKEGEYCGFTLISAEPRFEECSGEEEIAAQECPVDEEISGNEESSRYKQSNFQSANADPNGSTKGQCRPWYAMFSPYWWFGYGLDKEITIENRMKKVEKKSINNFVDVFKPAVKKSCSPIFSTESIHITKVERSYDERAPYENLIKIQSNKCEKPGIPWEVSSYYMSEEDIDYEIDLYDKHYPYYLKHDEKCIPASESLTGSSAVENAHNFDGDISNGAMLEDWLSNSKVIFDENGDQKIVPLSHNEAPLHKKINDILNKNHRLIWLSTDDDNRLDVPKDFPKELAKYWLQRYRLFLKFDEGIQLDNESWFSVTPEMIAAHQAYRCSCDVVVDAFCGAGGNAIQLAFTCHRVIAIDIDPKKIEIARHNAKVYGVADRIDFIQGDFFQLAPSLKADTVLLSPPWGGINYNKDNNYDVFTLGGTMKCKALFDAARKISSNIALYVPRSSNLLQLIELAGSNGKVDIEFNCISNKRKSITAYYGYLADYYEDIN